MLMFWLALGLTIVALSVWAVVLFTHAPLWIAVVVSVVCFAGFLLVLIVR